MQNRWILGLTALVAIVVFEAVVFYEVHIVWAEFWTIVAAEVLVGGGGVVIWTFRPEIMDFIGKAPTLLVQLTPDPLHAWHDNSPHKILMDAYTLMKNLPDEGEILDIISQLFKATMLNGSSPKVGARIWIEGGPELHPTWARVDSTFDTATGHVIHSNPPRFIPLMRGESEDMGLWMAYKTKDAEVLVLNTDNKAADPLNKLREVFKKDYVDLQFQFFGEKLREQPRYHLRLDISSFESLKAVQIG